MSYNYRSAYENELMHYGVLGMKWGVRRYQNPDGSLTDAGKKRYLNSDNTLTKEGLREYWRGRNGSWMDVYNKQKDTVEAFINMYVQTHTT